VGTELAHKARYAFALREGDGETAWRGRCDKAAEPRLREAATSGGAGATPGATRDRSRHRTCQVGVRLTYRAWTFAYALRRTSPEACGRAMIPGECVLQRRGRGLEALCLLGGRFVSAAIAKLPKSRLTFAVNTSTHQTKSHYVLQRAPPRHAEQRHIPTRQLTGQIS
jgi:hypothetical protein